MQAQEKALAEKEAAPLDSDPMDITRTITYHCPKGCGDSLFRADQKRFCFSCGHTGEPESVLPTPAPTTGMKHDGDKPEMALLSSSWVFEVAKVLTFGKRKYAADNWRQGIAQRRLVSAALRHLLAYNNGEDLDPETGLSHLGHASCCMMFAFELLQTHPELDDRWKSPLPKPL